MTSSQILPTVERLRALADSYELDFCVDIQPPATLAEIHDVEITIGAQLPASLSRFLQVYNGIRLEFVPKPRTIDDGELSFEKLKVFGTNDIARLTRNLHLYLGGYDIEANDDPENPPPYPSPLRVKAYRCIDMASVASTSSMRVVYSPDERRPSGEYAIIEAELNTMTWLSYLENDIPRILVAESFDEFLDKSLDCILSEKRTFRYWEHDLPY